MNEKPGDYGNSGVIMLRVIASTPDGDEVQVVPIGFHVWTGGGLLWDRKEEV